MISPELAARLAAETAPDEAQEAWSPRLPDLSTDEARAALRARCEAVARHFGRAVFSKNRPERTWTTEE
jgi:hypothetical protein